MGREIKMVPVNFDWPLKQTWNGFLNPYYKHSKNCPECDGSGYSKRAKEISDEWYGSLYETNFKPEDTGSTPFTIQNEKVRKFAARNTYFAIEYQKLGGYDEKVPHPNEEQLQEIESNIAYKTLCDIEAQRLCNHWNASWSHHLAQEDVDALWKEGRLKLDFKDKKPTAKEVNEWSI